MFSTWRQLLDDLDCRDGWDLAWKLVQMAVLLAVGYCGVVMMLCLGPATKGW